MTEITTESTAPDSADATEMPPIPGLDDKMRARLVTHRSFLEKIVIGYRFVTAMGEVSDDPAVTPERMIATQANVFDQMSADEADAENYLTRRDLHELLALATSVIATREFDIDEELRPWGEVTDGLQMLLTGLHEVVVAEATPRATYMVDVVRRFTEIETDRSNPARLTRIELVQVLAILLAANVDMLVSGRVTMSSMRVCDDSTSKSSDSVSTETGEGGSRT